MKGMPAWIVVALFLVGLYCDGIPWKFMGMGEGKRARVSMTIPFYMRQEVVTYNVSAVSVAKPTNQSNGLVLHEMSIVVKNSNLTQNVSDSIILCMANRTLTPTKYWGLYNHSRFSNTLIQAEYYGHCARTRALAFRTNITQYLTDKELSTCVKKIAPEFASVVAGTSPDIVYARNIVESLPNGKHHEGGIAAWIVGAVVGGILLSAVIVSVIVMIKRVRVYEPVEYDPEPNWKDEELTECGQARAEFEKNLKAITVGYN